MTKTVYLITGPSGSGKTCLAGHLASQGYQTIDADSTPGLCFFVNKNNKPVPRPANTDAAWWQTHNYVWELDRLAKLINSLEPTNQPVFLCGNAGNIHKAWDLFTTVFYLDIPTDIIQQRIAAGNHDHNFGQGVDEKAQLIRWIEPFKEQMLKLGAVSIDASRPVPVIAKDIANRTKNKA